MLLSDNFSAAFKFAEKFGVMYFADISDHIRQALAIVNIKLLRKA